MLSPRHVDGTESAAAGEVAAPTTAANIIGGFSSDCTHSSSSSSARGSGNEDRFCRSVQSDHDDADDDGCCQTPELPTLPRADVTAVEDDVVAADAALCRRRLEEADDEGKDDTASAATERFDGPLELVSEEEYARVCVMHLVNLVFRRFCVLRWSGFPTILTVLQIATQKLCPGCDCRLARNEKQKEVK